MDLNTIQSLIESVGFPIVCVLGLGFFIWKIWNRQQEQNEKREEKLYSFVKEAQAVNEKLTETNAQFVEVLENYQADLEHIKSDVSEIKIKLEKG